MDISKGSSWPQTTILTTISKKQSWACPWNSESTEGPGAKGRWSVSSRGQCSQEWPWGSRTLNITDQMEHVWAFSWMWKDARNRKRHQPRYGWQAWDPEKHFFLIKWEEESSHFQTWTARMGKWLLPAAQFSYLPKHLPSGATDRGLRQPESWGGVRSWYHFGGTVRYRSSWFWNIYLKLNEKLRWGLKFHFCSWRELSLG